MSEHILIIAKLNELTEDLADTQMLINQARVVHSTDQLFQLELDRQQTEVDEKRRIVEALKFDIPRRN